MNKHIEKNKHSIRENGNRIHENKAAIEDNRKRIHENKTEIDKLREEYRWLSESSQSRLERINHRLVVVILVLIGLLIGTNAAWIIL